MGLVQLSTVGPRHEEKNKIIFAFLLTPLFLKRDHGVGFVHLSTVRPRHEEINEILKHALVHERGVISSPYYLKKKEKKKVSLDTAISHIRVKTRAGLHSRWARHACGNSSYFLLPIVNF